jgi:hypothetical protein
MKKSVKLTDKNAQAITRHAEKDRRSFNEQANLAIEDWLVLQQASAKPRSGKEKP